MNKKGFFGYGRCPHCDAFLKEKDLENNTCWNCEKALEEKQKDKKIEESSNDNKIIINDYLNNLQLSSPKVTYSNFHEAQQELNNLYKRYSSIIVSNGELNDYINSLISNSDFSLFNQLNEVEIYAFGVRTFYEGISTSIRDYFNLAANIFSICISLKSDYHQAYNRLGDSLLKIDKPKQALIMYKTAINYILNNNSYGYVGKEVYIGDNYFKMAICQKSLDNKNIILSLIEEARIFIGEDYSDFAVWGFKDWDDVVKILYEN